ncbi:hypothetical protein Y032_0061g3246 [Ancylostoma ceylanicum]|uniref:Uncharacterized protein n=1 Tax=Ancylostoma ceylanicum TaxID=53326 RepID=A0A016U2B7_9BILA|nr:hypothetical protein Y032_0061g3246 [Ancylostoma ceylanicum]
MTGYVVVVSKDKAFQVRFRLSRTTFSHVRRVIHGSLTSEAGKGKNLLHITCAADCFSDIHRSARCGYGEHGLVHHSAEP